LGDNFEVIAII